MTLAIVGAGLAGLSAAWHLSSDYAVTVFDPEGIGGGASGIASGLMHPYPGEQARRSLYATEGLFATQRLLDVAQAKSHLPLMGAPGIIRYAQTLEQCAQFTSHKEVFGDVENQGDNAFLITSGRTVFCRRYLEALFEVLLERGVHLVRRRIESTEELMCFDRVVLAAGSGIKRFVEAEPLNISLMKGQILTCGIPKGISFPENSLIGKGYIAHAELPGQCYVGSTYEKGEMCPLPNREKAVRDILGKISGFYPDVHLFSILDCRAAFRVVRAGHYLPIVKRLSERVWACTALGSRGLLYHGLIGEWLKSLLLI